VARTPRLAAKLTTQDFIEIRRLAGDDHGYLRESLWGPPQARTLTTRRGASLWPRSTAVPVRPVCSLTVSPEGNITGLAYIRNNGGHYEDSYVKTPQGWRIKERKYVPPTGAGTKVAGQGLRSKV
jgi:hypothetical protein